MKLAGMVNQVKNTWDHAAEMAARSVLTYCYSYSGRKEHSKIKARRKICQ